jgi:hypothetical protein
VVTAESELRTMAARPPRSLSLPGAASPMQTPKQHDTACASLQGFTIDRRVIRPPHLKSTSERQENYNSTSIALLALENIDLRTHHTQLFRFDRQLPPLLSL